jgi:hypothetical protein
MELVSVPNCLDPMLPAKAVTGCSSQDIGAAVMAGAENLWLELFKLGGKSPSTAQQSLAAGFSHSHSVMCPQRYVTYVGTYLRTFVPLHVHGDPTFCVCLVHVAPLQNFLQTCFLTGSRQTRRSIRKLCPLVWPLVLITKRRPQSNGHRSVDNTTSLGASPTDSSQPGGPMGHSPDSGHTGSEPPSWHGCGRGEGEEGQG